MKCYLAIDLGASSGRHIVGIYKDENIVLDEVYRFETGMELTNDGLVWNTKRLFNEILNGISLALNKYPKIESLSIDTWGVDYVLMNNDKVIEPNYSYRNNRVINCIDNVHSLIPFSDLYSITGIQYAPYNTIYQLYDDLLKGRLKMATDFLMLPQYFVYLLTGVKKHEYTEASTTGLIDVNTNQYSVDIIRKLGFPIKIFKKCDNPGTIVGFLKKEIANKVGGQIKVVLAPSHDTASAFEAIDTPSDAAILSSGTWSLLGYKLKQANTSASAFDANFTNEGGVGYIRFLKNIMGMWVPNQVQKCLNISIQDMISLARNSSYNEVFDINDPSLNSPSNMCDAIISLLHKNPPKNNADLLKSVYLSLAHSYANTIMELEKCLNIKINSLYIVGGGSKNAFLNELTEKVAKVKVVALPIEATAIGNIKTQIRASQKL